MRVIICGGRDHPAFLAERGYLDDLMRHFGITEVIVGGAAGADTEGELWARARGIDVTVMPANWKAYGKAAGPLRNKRMLLYLCAFVPGPHAVIAFPGSKGTQSMVDLATSEGVPVFRYPVLPFEGERGA